MSIPSAIKLRSSSTFFDYVINQRPDHTEIVIQFFTAHYTTQPFPSTISVLETLLPRIFRHKCYNNQKNSFKKEAKNTELGHLFEHILLEFLCIYKYREGQLRFNLKGVTEWNWSHDPKGIFYISLNTKSEDYFLLQQALVQTQKLMETILLTNAHHHSNQRHTHHS